jgi:hypothetical protein
MAIAPAVTFAVTTSSPNSRSLGTMSLNGVMGSVGFGCTHYARPPLEWGDLPEDDTLYASKTKSKSQMQYKK